MLAATETDRVVPLAEGGENKIESTACLCALHHREILRGKKRANFTSALQAIRNGCEAKVAEPFRSGPEHKRTLPESL